MRHRQLAFKWFTLRLIIDAGGKAAMLGISGGITLRCGDGSAQAGGAGPPGIGFARLCRYIGCDGGSGTIACGRI